MNFPFVTVRGQDASDHETERRTPRLVFHHHRFRHFARLASVLTGIVFAALNPSRVAAQVTVRVERLSGTPVVGRLTRLTESTLELSSDSDETQHLDRQNIITVRGTDFDEFKTLPVSKSSWLFLSSDDRLRMIPLMVDDERIVAKWSSFNALPAVSLPLELCRGLVISVPVAPLQQARVFDQLLNHDRKVDLITLSNGDRIDGEFISLENEQFTLDTSIGEVQTRVDQTRSLFFNRDLVSEPAPMATYSVLTLSDGSTIYADSISSDGDLIIVESVGRFSISIPVTALRMIQFYDSGRVDLTQIEPATTKITPFLSTRHEPKRNRNVTGGLLSVRGQLSPTGIGVMSGTSQTWNLNRDYSQFRATVGIDDAAQGAGSVVFQVFVDDTLAWESNQIVGTSARVEIPPVDLTRADQLSLVVRFADRGNVSDYANWCEPVLIRKPNPPNTR